MAPHLPSGYSASSISGLVGLNCVALPFGAKPDTWFVFTRSIDDIKLKHFLLALTNLSAAQTIPMVSSQLYDHIPVL